MSNSTEVRTEVKVLIDRQIAVLEEMQIQAKRLKERFRRTEQKEWIPSTISAELSFQTTHLLNSVIRNAISVDDPPIGPSPGIDKGLEDEIADVVFNLMNLANLRGFNIRETINIAIEQNYQLIARSQDSVLKASNIVIQAGELWDAIFRKEGFKHMSREPEANDKYINMVFGGIIICTILLARDLNIDITKGFSEMIIDSNNSLDRMGIEA